MVGGKDATYSLGTLNMERLLQLVNGFRMKPYYGKMPPKPFLKDLQIDAMEPTHIGGPQLDPFRGSKEPCGCTLKAQEPCGGT